MTGGRSSCGSEVMMLDEPAIQAGNPSRPVISSLNINQSSRVHIGPKFVVVTQNVDSTKVVKVLSLHRYIWHWAKTMTTAEKIFCAAAIVAIVVCLVLILYFTVIAKNKEQAVNDVAPHTWYITRDMWLATKYDESVNIAESFNPLKLVIVAHTVGAECNTFVDCAAELRSLQSYYIYYIDYDIPYNFLIGNDGRVYEGTGFNIVGAHTYGYNRCSLGLAFIGDYREGLPAYSKVTPLQQQRAYMLFEKGIQLGYLHPDFDVLGAMDVQATSLSPGTNLYTAIQQWPNYGHKDLYQNKTCEQIQQMYKNETVTSTTTVPTTSVSFT